MSRWSRAWPRWPRPSRLTPGNSATSAKGPASPKGPAGAKGGEVGSGTPPATKPDERDIRRELPGQVSLLRGINVGGNNKIAMSRLRQIYTALGMPDATTHINSGNVIVRTNRDPDDLSREVERAIERELGLQIRVLGRTHEQLGRIVSANPFPGADLSRHIVAFLSGTPPQEAIERLRARAEPGEEIAVVGRELHLLYPDGMGSSKLSPALIERSGVVATARNLRTVMRLHELTAPTEAT